MLYESRQQTERNFVMPNIKPVSDLRNYTEVLNTVSVGNPVFLTKNGRERYVILDIDEYIKMQVALKLMGELSKGELSMKKSRGGGG